MSANQCKNCGGFTDFNNNHSAYSNGYSMLNSNHHSPHAQISIGGSTQVIKAKIMWGTVGAIKELRDKEQAEKNRASQRRQ